MKNALITGANRGLGFETARQLGHKGFNLLLGVRKETDGIEAVDKLKDEGLKAQFVKLDVHSNSDIRALVEYIKEAELIPDVLVNNAGVFLESREGDQTTSVFSVNPVIVLKTIETNTMGPLKLIQSLVPLMRNLDDARIINISSGLGQLSEMGGQWPGYRMSKASLNVLTKIVAAEMTGTTVSINSVCPGWVRTDMGGPHATRSLKEGVETTVWLATMINPPTGGFYRDKELIKW